MSSVIHCVFFFFKQKTAYEMLRSLVGSEMCIRDRPICFANPIDHFFTRCSANSKLLVACDKFLVVIVCLIVIAERYIYICRRLPCKNLAIETVGFFA